MLRTLAHAAFRHAAARQRETRALGLDLVVPPTVFHPRWFASSVYLARAVERLDLRGARVADLGTGTGLIALAAERAGAASVLAVDVNPAAARAARENARRNGLDVRVVCGDWLSAIAPATRFDLLVANPPFFPEQAHDTTDRAWRAGLGFCDLAPLFAQARERLAPDGRALVVLSTAPELTLLLEQIEDAGLRHRVLSRKKLLFESLVLYELRPS